MKKKIRLVVEGDVFYITENPDAIVVGHGNTTPEYAVDRWGSGQKIATWKDSDAAPFGLYNGKWKFGNTSDTHGDINVNEDPDGRARYVDRPNFKYPGRLWIRKKIISFWTYPKFSDLRGVLHDIEKAAKAHFGTSNINIMSYRMDIPRSEEMDKMPNGSKPSQVFRDVVVWDEALQDRVFQNTRVYAIKNVLGDMPLKGLGKAWKEAGKEINTDKGQEHMKSPLLKAKNIAKMTKKEKEDLYNDLKRKGGGGHYADPEEKRMWAMIQRNMKREGVDLYRGNGRIYLLEVSDSIATELASFEDEQVKMGMKVEKEHDGGQGKDIDIVSSEEDLMKIVLAHLREDPKYYSKLKKMEESSRSYFTLDEGTGILRRGRN